MNISLITPIICGHTHTDRTELTEKQRQALSSVKDFSGDHPKALSMKAHPNILMIHNQKTQLNLMNSQAQLNPLVIQEGFK